MPVGRAGVKYKDTYLYKLTENDSTWIVSRTGATTADLSENLLEVRRFIPAKFFNTSVIHTGLSDCAPRPLAHYWRNRLSKVRPKRLRRLIIRFLHRFRPQIQKYIGYHQRTSYERFRAEFEDIVKHCVVLSERVIIILMPGVQDQHDEHSPGIRYEEERYNDCMAEMGRKWGAEIIDCYDEINLDQKNITDDGHLAPGSQIIISRELQEILNRKTFEENKQTELPPEIHVSGSHIKGYTNAK